MAKIEIALLIVVLLLAAVSLKFSAIAEPISSTSYAITVPIEIKAE